MTPAADSRFDPRAKLALHAEFARLVRGEKVYPVNIEISPCGWCQARCAGCWYAHGAAGGHRKVQLDINRLKSLLREMAELGVKSVTWTGGGEPTLYKWFSLAVEEAHGLGLRQGLFTNALAHPGYAPHLLDWVRVTMTDRPWREECVEALRPCKVLGFAFNYAGPQDDAYLKETLDLAGRVYADYVQLRPQLAWNGETVDIRPPDISHPLLFVTGYKFEEARRKHPYKECCGYRLVPFVWEDGNLDVCAYNRHHDGYTLGNIYRDGLKAILDRAPESVPVHDGCQVACRLHEINLAAHHARQLKDVDFP